MTEVDTAVAAESGTAADERRLLIRHLNGDTGAFAELVARYRAPVYSYLVRTGVAEGDRDDLFQEIFLRVHRGAGGYRAELPLHPWIFTVVANAVRTYHKRRRVRQLVQAEPPEIEPAVETPDGERAAAARQTMAWLERQLARLPLARREVLLLVCVEGLQLQEAAAALKMPLGSVKTHLRRARLALAQALAARNQGEVAS